MADDKVKMQSMAGMNEERILASDVFESGSRNLPPPNGKGTITEDALLDAAHRPAHPLAVHARAVRWALDHAESAEAEAGPMLAGLEKVAARYGAAGAQAAGPAA